MSEQDDKIFMKRFSLVIVGLVLFAALIIIVAIYVNSQIAGSPNPARDAATVQRIKPVFDVYTGETGRAEAQAAAEEPASPQQQQGAFGGTMDGETIYNNACQACHMTGAAGAPQLVAEQWTDRLDKGEETLVDHAINGFGAMPAKGGRTDLTDEQVRAAVEYMLGEIE